MQSIARLPAIHNPLIGGIDTGLFEPAGREPYRIVACLLPEAQSRISIWGKYGQLIPGADSDWDGVANTQAILRADPDNYLARFVTSLEVNGHRDYYTGAKDELVHVYKALGELVYDFLPNGWTWSSTQSSAYYAWDQYFGDGFTYYWDKGSLASVLALRRLSN